LDRGLRTVYVPDVRVLHGGFSSGGEAKAAELFERNRPTFVARWGDTIAASSGDPEPWWQLGVEVLLREDPDVVPAERAGHYDVVATPTEFAAPATLAALRSAVHRA